MFPKGGMGGLYKQAQQMKKKMSQVQSEIDALEIEGESGGGMVKVIVSGKKTLISVYNWRVNAFISSFWVSKNSD